MDCEYKKNWIYFFKVSDFSDRKILGIFFQEQWQRWRQILNHLILIFLKVLGTKIQRHLTSRLRTSRSRGTAVIFLFGLEALFTRSSRAQLCAVCSLPRTVECYWLSCLPNQFLLAPTGIKPVYYSILSTVWALGKSYLSTCRQPHSLAQSSHVMSLTNITLFRWGYGKTFLY